MALAPEVFRRACSWLTRSLVLVLPLSLAGVSVTFASGCAARSSWTASVAPVPARLDFVENDYAHALSLARQRGKPLFVDAWAPWCHTCLSMREFVFNQPEIRAHGGDFVWLAMDTETEPGQEFLARYPMRAWPTLWIVDAKTETPRLKWEAAATAPELARLLEAAKTDAAASTDGSGGGSAERAVAAEGARIRGERAAARGDSTAAIAELRQALRVSAPSWPGAAQTVEALASVLEGAKDRLGCIAVADHYEPDLVTLPKGTSRANVAMAAFRCAAELPVGAPERRIDERMARLVEIARDASYPLLPDDRSDIYSTLVEYLKDPGPQHDPARMKALATEWSAFDDAAAARARTPAARAVFDAHRMFAYFALGEPARAIPMLEQSERDFPEDYNPPARLAKAELEAGQPERALAAIDRALALAYGPRKLSLVVLKCDVMEALQAGGKAGANSDAHAEKKLIEDTLASAEATRGTGSASTRAKELRARLERLNAAER